MPTLTSRSFQVLVFVFWKRSLRRRPRPGTRKGINRAAAWRACERPHMALLEPPLWVLRILRRYKLSEFRRLKREPDPLRQTAPPLAAEAEGGPSGPQDAFKGPPRRLIFAIHFLVPLKIDFYWILEANLPQLGLQNPIKFMKNRCQEAFPS